jgi:hypothetical protein
MYLLGRLDSKTETMRQQYGSDTTAREKRCDSKPKRCDSKMADAVRSCRSVHAGEVEGILQ